MCHCIPMVHEKIQIQVQILIQTLTHGYQNSHDPDIFQNVMVKLVQGMEYIKTYLDDLLILTNRDNSFKYHLLKLEMVLTRLSTNESLV
jgi:hypothetical protein